MKSRFLSTSLFILAACFASGAHADLASMLRDIDKQAKSDLMNFNKKLSQQFGLPLPQVDLLLKKVETPSDAFMVLHLGQMTGKPPEIVSDTYRVHKKKGWGAIAQELGIRPGSAEFHALRRGEFALTGERRERGERYERRERREDRREREEREEHGHGKGAGKGSAKGW